MTDITVDIEAPGGVVFEDTIIPQDYMIAHVITELVEELNLPRLSDGGEPITYSILNVTNNEMLRPEQILSQSRIRSGDTIRLVPSHDVQATSIGKFEDEAKSNRLNDTNIEIVLSVLDLNKSERISLETDLKIGEIIRRIVANYDLPSRDKLNEVITYRIASKALGRYLRDSETVKQAAVPHLDRLSLHREEIAGA